MKIGNRYIYLLKVCRAIDEAHLGGLIDGIAHVHFNPGHGQEEAPLKRSPREKASLIATWALRRDERRPH